MQASAFFEQIRRRVQKRPISIFISRRAWLPLYGVIGVIALWQIVVMLQIYPRFIIPAPYEVLQRFVQVVLDGQLWLNASTTLSQMLPGLAIGVSIAAALGIILAKSPILEAVLSPLIVTVQSTPVVAYAPLLVIWFGSGGTSKIVTTALIVFFPMLMNTLIGVRSVPPELRDLMRSLNATRWQTFVKLELPSALPVMLGGLKVSATLAVIGAVVGEFISADAGLGRLINTARYNFDTPLVFVAIITLALIARTMYGLVTLLERRLLSWQRR